MQIEIKKPCTEQWEGMATNTDGRYCSKCCKTVIDFSTWETDVIANYLKQNSGKETCGRLLTSQTAHSQPMPPYSAQLSFLNKMAAAVLVAVGFISVGCKSKENERKIDTAKKDAAQCDSVLTINNSYILGGIGPAMPDSVYTQRTDTIL